MLCVCVCWFMGLNREGYGKIHELHDKWLCRLDVGRAIMRRCGAVLYKEFLFHSIEDDD